MRHLYILLHLALLSLLSFEVKGSEPVKGNEMTVDCLSFSSMDSYRNEGNDLLKYARKAKLFKVAGGVSLGLGRCFFGVHSAVLQIQILPIP